MQAINRPFTDILGGNNRQFIIPVFQRDYNWTREQCEQLWNDVLRVRALRKRMAAISSARLSTSRLINSGAVLSEVARD